MDTREWTVKTCIYDKQPDFYNCGVLICQYAECFLKKKNLEGLLCPDEFRHIMKEKLLLYSDNMMNVCLHCGGEIDTFDDKCAKCSRYICMHWMFYSLLPKHKNRMLPILFMLSAIINISSCYFGCIRC